MPAVLFALAFQRVERTESLQLNCAIVPLIVIRPLTGTCPILQFYYSEHMQKIKLNTWKQDIYSFLHFLLPTNPLLFGPGLFCLPLPPPSGLAGPFHACGPVKSSFPTFPNLSNLSYPCSTCPFPAPFPSGISAIFFAKLKNIVRKLFKIVANKIFLVTFVPVSPAGRSEQGG